MMKKRGADGPAHEPLIAALAGLIFVIVGGRHDGSLGSGFTILGFMVIGLGALAFCAQFLSWWRNGER